MQHRAGTDSCSHPGVIPQHTQKEAAFRHASACHDRQCGFESHDSVAKNTLLCPLSGDSWSRALQGA